MSKPCEYCGADLPLGVDKSTRRVRSFHFANCERRPEARAASSDITAQRDALLEALRAMRVKYGQYACRACDLADAAIAAVEGEIK